MSGILFAALPRWASHSSAPGARSDEAVHLLVEGLFVLKGCQLDGRTVNAHDAPALAAAFDRANAVARNEKDAGVLHQELRQEFALFGIEPVRAKDSHLLFNNPVLALQK